ncbi:MAG: helix-turn-helix transcriptional regulator [Sulfitobacter sp.]|nr:helix-turn-helix transcriptional regulator [Sulfitobacter sp.]
MYDPKGNGKEKSVAAVTFVEREPPAHLQGVVHRYLHLKTEDELAEPYRFHALPDACTYLVLDQLDPSVAGVTRLRAESEEFDLGRRFHYVNVRFLPGVWQYDLVPAAFGQLRQSYSGELPLLELNRAIVGRPFEEAADLISDLVVRLLEEGVVARNPVTAQIFQNLDEIKTAADMADCVGLSPRQLQRRLKQSTGFAPHDFLKILRLQMALNGADTWSYADQSHFIHSFRRATGYTPGKYALKFDV